MVAEKLGDHIFFDNVLIPYDLVRRNRIYKELRWDIVRDYLSLTKLIDGTNTYPKIISLCHNLLPIHSQQKERLERLCARANNKENLVRVFYNGLPSRTGYHALQYILELGWRFNLPVPVVLVHSNDNPIAESIMLDMAEEYYNKSKNNEEAAVFSGNGF